MIHITLKMEGEDRLYWRLRKLTTGLRGRTSARMTDAVGRWIQKSAKLRAPVKTGRLRQSIRLVRRKYNRVDVVADVPYAAAMELGVGLPKLVPIKLVMYKRRTRGAVIRKPGAIPRRKGYAIVRTYKPFMRPAVEAARKNMKNIIAPIIGRELR